MKITRKKMLKNFSRKAYEARVAELAIGVAARFSRGNVAMQYGFMLSQEDLELERQERREKVRGK